MKREPRTVIDYSSWTLEQFKEELKTKQEYLDYYNQFDPESIDKFIDVYAPIKLQMHENKNSYQLGTEWYRGRFLELADKYIDIILQKKLFNLQCEWRAGLIDLPMVSISRDFEYWSHHIRACPFIPLITPEEVDLCKSFMEQEYDFYAEAAIIGNKWQDYETFKYYESEEEEEDSDEAKRGEYSGLFASNLPAFYAYFDTYQNTSSLINLPDVRGDKEDTYIHLAYHIERMEKEKLEENVPKDETPIETVVREGSKPTLHYGTAYIKAFVDAVENPESKEAHEYYYDNYHLDRDYEFEECLFYLRDFKEPFPIEAHEDWREAVRLVLQRQTQLRAADLLPYVYETYLMEFDEPHNFKKIMADKIARHKYDTDNSLVKLIEQYKRLILKARKALREEENFDY